MRLRKLTVSILSAGVLCLPAWGQNTAQPKKSSTEAHRTTDEAARGAGDRWDGTEEVERLTQELTLSKDQQAQVRKLLDGYLKVEEQALLLVAKNLNELRRLDKRIKNNRVGGDREKVTELSVQQTKLMGSEQVNAASEKLQSAIAAVLTPEQKTNAARSEGFDPKAGPQFVVLQILAGDLGDRWLVDQRVERLHQELTLSQDQQDKIADLISDYCDQAEKALKAPLEEHLDEFKDLSAKAKAARDSGNKEQVQNVQAQRRELGGADQCDAAYEKLVSNIEAVLTRKQRTQFQQITSDLLNWLPWHPFPQSAWLKEQPEVFMKAVQSLKLPQDRQTKVKAMFDDAATKAKASPEAKLSRTDAAGLYSKVMAELNPHEQSMVKVWEPDPPAGQRRRR
jgi:hypothetical protein